MTALPTKRKVVLVAEIAYVPTRLGFYTLRKLAHGLCLALPKFSPLIRAAFPDNVTLLAALAAAEAACHELVSQIDAQKAALYPP
jgi:hypothetical protein